MKGIFIGVCGWAVLWSRFQAFWMWQSVDFRGFAKNYLSIYFHLLKIFLEEWDWLGMWCVWVRWGRCTGSCWGNRREGDHWGDVGVDGWIIIGRISRRWDVGIWTGSGWIRIETGGGRLWVRWWTFGFREMRGISWLAANQLASREGLCTMEWVSK